LHGWTERKSKPEVWDAVIFSTELDLLEIRMNELDDVVDKFFIVESDSQSPLPSVQPTITSRL
jgi:beta-1,4-mannosyl-glycoprotein beta-1,4-N-acetylglucosaminyltransferase